MHTSLDNARKEGRRRLSEPEGFDLLSSIGVVVPVSVTFTDTRASAMERLPSLPGKRGVLKIVSPGLAHKTEVGGVQPVDLEPEAIRRAAVKMKSDLGDLPFAGFLLQEQVIGDGPPGSELLVSCRLDREFGPVVSVAAGGRYAEQMAQALRPGSAMATFPLTTVAPRAVGDTLAGLLPVEMLTRTHRGRAPVLTPEALIAQLIQLGQKVGPLLSDGVQELEINPVVVRSGQLVALDVLVDLMHEPWPVSPPRPGAKLQALLQPRSIAIIGVSQQQNVGRRILENILAHGFDRQQIIVIKPGVDELAGCRCVPAIGALPLAVDLLIVAIAAPGVPAVVEEVVDRQLAESLIVIPGGFGETATSASLVESVDRKVQGSRSSSWGGPLINGGNCMGIRSVPGDYDTFFLPDYKLPRMPRDGGSVAIVSQSGALLAAKGSKLGSIDFRYQVSIGNQLDLTFGDYMEFWLDDPKVRIVAVYAEGFKTLDGQRFLAAADRMYRQGRTVILYRAGRSLAGRRAAASHTAAIAGNYGITAGLASSSGILLADTLTEFEDLIALAAGLEGRKPTGRRLAGVSNAGFECVALSDRLGWFAAAELSDRTRTELRRLLRQAGVEHLVELENPLDVTPMVGDEIFGRVVATVLDDIGVDVAVVGCVPLTGTLQTLPAAARHGEDVERPESVAGRLIEVWRHSAKPWVAVIDAGRDYDRLADRLAEAGLPVFRAIDRAVTMLGRFLRYRFPESVSAPSPALQG